MLLRMLGSREEAEDAAKTPLMSMRALGPRMTPLGLMRKMLARGTSDEMVPSIVEREFPVTRPMKLSTRPSHAPEQLKLAVSASVMLNEVKL